MKTDILIRSYAKDFCWLEYALLSCSISAVGFDQVHVVVPHQDSSQLSLTREKLHSCIQNIENGYLHQQITKLKADQYSAADVIWLIDSDTIFARAVNPSDMIEEGKVVMYFEPYSAVGDQWKSLTEAAVGFPVEFEFMRRPPHVYPRWLFGEVRRHLDKVHGNWEKYIATRPGNCFSEYNVMGAVAYEHFRDQFAWRSPHEDQPLVHQYWSWGGIEGKVEEIQGILRGLQNNS